MLLEELGRICRMFPGTEVTASAVAQPALQGTGVAFFSRRCPDNFEDYMGPPAKWENGGQVMAELFWLCGRHVAPSPGGQSMVDMEIQRSPVDP